MSFSLHLDSVENQSSGLLASFQDWEQPNDQAHSLWCSWHSTGRMPSPLEPNLGSYIIGIPLIFFLLFIEVIFVNISLGFMSVKSKGSIAKLQSVMSSLNSLKGHVMKYIVIMS